jgi:hypothetical protein
MRGQDLRRLPRVDESARDPQLAALLTRIKQIAAKRDRDALQTLANPDFRVEFDEGKGPAALRKKWFSGSNPSQLWQILERILTLGGSFYSPTLFAAPYVYTRFPKDLDPLAHVVVTGAMTLYARNSQDAAAAANAIDEILPLAAPLEPPVWLDPAAYISVRHPAAGTCFARGSEVYSPAGHRMFFEKVQGRWRWISLAAATLADPPELRQRKSG